jgi:hypothetical protein
MGSIYSSPITLLLLLQLLVLIPVATGITGRRIISAQALVGLLLFHMEELLIVAVMLLVLRRGRQPMLLEVILFLILVILAETGTFKTRGYLDSKILLV